MSSTSQKLNSSNKDYGLIVESDASFNMFTAINESSADLPEGILMRLHGTFIPMDIPGTNGRWYTYDEYKPHVESLMPKIQRKELFGEIEHPQRVSVPYDLVSHRIDEVYYDKDSNSWKGTISILDTEKGRHLYNIARTGAPLYVSHRALGSMDKQTSKGIILKLITWDVTSIPSFNVAEFNKAVPINESAYNFIPLEGDFLNEAVNTIDESFDAESIVNAFLEEHNALAKSIKNMPVNSKTETILNKLYELTAEHKHLSEQLVYDNLTQAQLKMLHIDESSYPKDKADALKQIDKLAKSIGISKEDLELAKQYDKSDLDMLILYLKNKYGNHKFTDIVTFADYYITFVNESVKYSDDLVKAAIAYTTGKTLEKITKLSNEANQYSYQIKGSSKFDTIAYDEVNSIIDEHKDALIKQFDLNESVKSLNDIKKLIDKNYTPEDVVKYCDDDTIDDVVNYAKLIKGDNYADAISKAYFNNFDKTVNESEDNTEVKEGMSFEHDDKQWKVVSVGKESSKCKSGKDEQDIDNSVILENCKDKSKEDDFVDESTKLPEVGTKFKYIGDGDDKNKIYTVTKPGLRKSNEKLAADEVYLTTAGSIGFDISVNSDTFKKDFVAVDSLNESIAVEPSQIVDDIKSRKYITIQEYAKEYKYKDEALHPDDLFNGAIALAKEGLLYNADAIENKDEPEIAAVLTAQQTADMLGALLAEEQADLNESILSWLKDKYNAIKRWANSSDTPLFTVDGQDYIVDEIKPEGEVVAIDNSGNKKTFTFDEVDKFINDCTNSKTKKNMINENNELQAMLDVLTSKKFVSSEMNADEYDFKITESGLIATNDEVAESIAAALKGAGYTVSLNSNVIEFNWSNESMSVQVGQKYKGTEGVTKNKVGVVTKVQNDMATIDFGNGDTYGIMLSRIESGEFEFVNESSVMGKLSDKSAMTLLNEFIEGIIYNIPANDKRTQNLALSVNTKILTDDFDARADLTLNEKCKLFKVFYDDGQFTAAKNHFPDAHAMNIALYNYCVSKVGGKPKMLNESDDKAQSLIDNEEFQSKYGPYKTVEELKAALDDDTIEQYYDDLFVNEASKPGRAWSGKLKNLDNLLSWMYDKDILSKSDKAKKDSLFRQYYRWYNDGDMPGLAKALNISKYDEESVELALEKAIDDFIKTILSKYAGKYDRQQFKTDMFVRDINNIISNIDSNDIQENIKYWTDKVKINDATYNDAIVKAEKSFQNAKNDFVKWTNSINISLDMVTDGNYVSQYDIDALKSGGKYVFKHLIENVTKRFNLTVPANVLKSWEQAKKDWQNVKVILENVKDAALKLKMINESDNYVFANESSKAVKFSAVTYKKDTISRVVHLSDSDAAKAIEDWSEWAGKFLKSGETSLEVMETSVVNEYVAKEKAGDSNGAMDLLNKHDISKFTNIYANESTAFNVTDFKPGTEVKVGNKIGTIVSNLPNDNDEISIDFDGKVKWIDIDKVMLNESAIYVTNKLADTLLTFIDKNHKGLIDDYDDLEDPVFYVIPDFAAKSARIVIDTVSLTKDKESKFYTEVGSIIAAFNKANKTAFALTSRKDAIVDKSMLNESSFYTNLKSHKNLFAKVADVITTTKDMSDVELANMLEFMAKHIRTNGLHSVLEVINESVNINNDLANEIVSIAMSFTDSITEDIHTKLLNTSWSLENLIAELNTYIKSSKHADFIKRVNQLTNVNESAKTFEDLAKSIGMEDKDIKLLTTYVSSFDKADEIIRKYERKFTDDANAVTLLEALRTDGYLNESDSTDVTDTGNETVIVSDSDKSLPVQLATEFISLTDKEITFEDWIQSKALDNDLIDNKTIVETKTAVNKLLTEQVINESAALTAKFVNESTQMLNESVELGLIREHIPTSHSYMLSQLNESALFVLEQQAKMYSLNESNIHEFIDTRDWQAIANASLNESAAIAVINSNISATNRSNRLMASLRAGKI